MAKYDVFISYRREGGYDTAKHLYDLLTRDGYRVSFDIDALRNGDFDKSLLQRIDECKDFILIIDSQAFDRTLNPNFNPNNDWMRQELAYALKKGKNVVPIFLNGVEGFPSNLPTDIANVVKKNSPKYDRYYFHDFYARLKKDFIESKPGKNRITKFVVTLIFIIVSICCILFYTNDDKDSELQMISKVDSTQNVTDNKGAHLQDSRTKAKKFCGKFSYTIPNVGYGGINYVYELVLDPINSSCSIVEDDIVNIKNSKGYYGTMMQWPEYWEVLDFSMSEDGSHAIVSMIGGDNCICKVKLELDSYNNIKMSFVEGTDGPGVLMDEYGNLSHTITFNRN